MDAWRASHLALGGFHFITADKKPARVEFMPIFAKFVAQRANNVFVSLCWPPSIGLYLDVLNFGNLVYSL